MFTAVAPHRQKTGPGPDTRWLRSDVDHHQEWRLKAACRNLSDEMFFPDGRTVRKRKRASWKQAQVPGKQICGDCPVRLNCLTYALVMGIEFGIWGGLDERERRDLARQMRRDARAAAAS